MAICSCNRSMADMSSSFVLPLYGLTKWVTLVFWIFSLVPQLQQVPLLYWCKVFQKKVLKSDTYFRLVPSHLLHIKTIYTLNGWSCFGFENHCLMSVQIRLQWGMNSFVKPDQRDRNTSWVSAFRVPPAPPAAIAASNQVLLLLPLTLSDAPLRVNSSKERMSHPAFYFSFYFAMSIIDFVLSLFFLVPG